MASQATAVMDERVVQTWALHYLHSRYAKANPGKRIFADVEMLLKKQYEGKKGYDRVDGLICIDKASNGFTVAIEAKSMKTLDSLFELLEPKAASTSELALLMFGTIGLPVISLWFFKALAWYWLVAMVLSELLAIAVTYVVYTDSAAASKTGVHEQLSKYAGNEKWLALPVQAQGNLTQNNGWARFVKICRHYGYGLVTVREDGFVFEIQKPTRVFKGNFISSYVSEEIIRATLAGNTTLNFNYAGCLNKSFVDKAFHLACKNPLTKVEIP